MKRLLSIFALASLFAAVTAGCTNGEDEGSAPGRLSNVRFTPLNGGGYFLYDIPTDPDLLYVKAVYKTDAGEEVIKTKSIYSDTLYVEGLGKAPKYDISLYTVNRENRERLSTIASVTPLRPITDVVAENVSVRGAFSAMIVDVQNPLSSRVDIYVTIQTENSTGVRVFSSNKSEERFFINDLENADYKVSVHTVDLYGNTSDSVDLGTITPIADYALDKTQWRLMDDEEIDSGNMPGPDNKNAERYVRDADCTRFWDGRIHDANNLSTDYNFFIAVGDGPISYFIDLGREVQASRVRVWQRQEPNYAYGRYNVKDFELWVSNDEVDGVVTNWERLNKFVIIEPTTETERDSELKNGHLFIIYPDDPVLTTPFRYMRYRALSPFIYQEDKFLCASEITLYGLEVEPTNEPTP